MLGIGLVVVFMIIWIINYFDFINFRVEAWIRRRKLSNRKSKVLDKLLENVMNLETSSETVVVEKKSNENEKPVVDLKAKNTNDDSI